MNDRQLYWLAGCLCLLGIGLFLFKTISLQYPLVPDATTRVWDVEVRIHFQPSGGPVKLRLFIPQGNSDLSITDEQFVSSGYGLGIKQRQGNRQALWTVRGIKGEQVIYYKGTVRPRAEPYLSGAKSPELPAVTLGEAQRIAAESLIAEAKKKSADSETLVRELFTRLSRNTGAAANDPAVILLGKSPDELKRLQMAVQLLALEKMPARIVNGLKLVDVEREAKFVHWLEVYHDKAWKAYQPLTGLAEMPDNYLAWWRGSRPLIQLSGGKLYSTRTAISRSNESSVVSAMQREEATQPLLHGFTLLDLPLDTQAVYRVLLTVPIGVLLLVVLRNIVGIKTFGTFMPVLIAMAFRETQLLWGIILFSLVVGAGLAIRFYFDQLKLLLVPRLAAVLITVIIIMMLISILSHKLGMHRGLSVALFPMVIMTMTIERMTIVWEERGANEAMKQGLGSLFVAALAYLLMRVDQVQHLLFMFPELLLVILAATLLLGRYRGYRLTELYRFRVLAKG